jgi:hypothetical protein
MQTRLRAAKEAALAQAAAQAAASAPPPPTTDDLLRTWSFQSSLTSLTPTPSFTAEVPVDTAPLGHELSFASTLSTLTELGEESDGEFESPIPGFGPRRRGLQTPVHSIGNVNSYQAEVQRTPRKTVYRPTNEHVRAAELVRDQELAASGPLARLTKQGTMLVPTPESFSAPSPSSCQSGHGLGSPFTSPTAPPAQHIDVNPSGTFSVNPNTGKLIFRK